MQIEPAPTESCSSSFLRLTRWLMGEREYTRAIAAPANDRS
jgi:hypothetical protein